MKILRLAFPLFVFAIVTAAIDNTAAHAQWFATDSAAVDSVFGFGNVIAADKVTGKPDNQLAQLKPGGTLYVGVKSPRGGAFPIMAGSKIVVFGHRDPADDSSFADIQFEKYDFSGALEYTSTPMRLGEGPIVVDVDREYSTAILTLSGSGTQGSAKSYFIDAVYLVQPFSGVHDRVIATNVGLMNAYPNPFRAGSERTTLTAQLERAAESRVVISDLLGRVVKEIDLGILGAGSHDVEVSMPKSGSYFARLVVNGQAVGSMLKLRAIN